MTVLKKLSLLETKGLPKTITSDDVLGKEVIDVDGEFLGVVDIVHLDPESLEFLGVSIDEGFLKKGLLIGRSYIKKVTSHALFLNIRPAFSLRNMTVFDKNGKKVGTVENVTLWQNRNIINELVLSIGWFKKIKIQGALIERIANNIFLNVAYDDIPGLKKS